MLQRCLTFHQEQKAIKSGQEQNFASEMQTAALGYNNHINWLNVMPLTIISHLLKPLLQKINLFSFAVEITLNFPSRSIGCAKVERCPFSVQKWEIYSTSCDDDDCRSDRQAWTQIGFSSSFWAKISLLQ